jgi:hypothetical protein
MALDFAGSRGGDELRQRLARDSSEGKIDNIRVAEQVVEERLDTLRGIRPTQLKQNYPEFQSISQSGEFTL